MSPRVQRKLRKLNWSLGLTVFGERYGILDESVDLDNKCPLMPMQNILVDETRCGSGLWLSSNIK